MDIDRRTVSYGFTKEMEEWIKRELLCFYENAVRRICLFGSRVVGDYEEESDLDVLCVVDATGCEVNNLFCDALDIMDEFFYLYDIPIDLILVDREQYERDRYVNMLFRNIDNEGIVLYG